METNEQSIPTYIPTSVQSDEMDWDAYADHYDLMCELNPSYNENLSILASRISSWQLPGNASICDLGAGTGNYIKFLSERLPEAEFTHVDFDEKMNNFAEKKYNECGGKNVRVVREYAQRLEMPPNSFDLILCVNALYAISPQKEVLRKIRTWLKPNGRFFVIDFGRKQRVLDWTFYLFRESMKNQKVGSYVKALFEGREVIKQNRRSTKGQKTGRYWTHTTEEFGGALEECGFELEELCKCYRDYSDLAICKK